MIGSWKSMDLKTTDLNHFTHEKERKEAFFARLFMWKIYKQTDNTQQLCSPFQTPTQSAQN